MSAGRTCRLLAAAVALGLPALSPGQAVPDFERGRALYENHCIVCHTSKVHRRFPPSAIDREALRYIVKVWAEEQKLRWGPDDIEDVTYYVERVHYRVEKP